MITHGEDVKHLGDVDSSQAQLAREMTGTTPKVGYYYSEFGLFWLNLWTWSGEYVLYTDDSVWPLKVAEQAAFFSGKKPDEVSTPWGYSFPPLLMILVIGGAVWVPMKIKELRE